MHIKCDSTVETEDVFRWKMGKSTAETEHGREIDITFDSDTCEYESNCKLLV